MLIPRTLFLAVVWLAAQVLLSTTSAADEQDGLAAFYTGEYRKVIQFADDAIENEPFVAENWFILKTRAQLALGEYAEALKTVENGLERFPYEVGIRWVGVDALRHNDEDVRAKALLVEIDKFWKTSSWRYRDPAELVVLGKAAQQMGVDARTILKKFFDSAANRNAQSPAPHQATGFLALEKHDYTLAIASFRKALDLDPADPENHYGLSRALAKSNGDASLEALNEALTRNPNHAAARLQQVDHLINAEQYDEADSQIEEILAVNPRQPLAWAYRAVISHLRNDPAAERECRAQALSSWKRNPEIDHLIGRKLSQKYRFAEGEAYQRRALVYDSEYLPAKIQLAHDLLRLGQELEGWKLADEVFDADQYSVVAHNLVTLRDNLTQFATLERDGFVVRMEKSEAAVYGEEVLELLDDAKEGLVKRYQAELEWPIFIEIFPNQQDFAIRTFGLPGGEGFLGVCFGRVITMNSPAAQGTSLTNWKSVLWHEFCHVVTLQKTNNRMPRWMSEGISVYEETRRNPAWGQSLNPRNRKMLVSGESLPLSDLSSAFLRPRSAEHLNFAYFESSLAIRFLVEEYGFESLLEVLDHLAIGIPVNDALRRATAPPNVLDAQFNEFLDEAVATYSKTGDWVDLDSGEGGRAVGLTRDFVQAHPNHRQVLVVTARKLEQAGDHEGALQQAETLRTLYDDFDARALAAQIEASNYRTMNQPEKERAALLDQLRNNASDRDAGIRGLQLSLELENWESAQEFARQLIGIDPMLKSTYRGLARAADATGDDALLISSLHSLQELKPIDSASVHYRLASALHRTGKSDLAKQQVIRALDQAPRYREAHALLLKLVTAESASAEQPADDKERKGEKDER